MNDILVLDKYGFPLCRGNQVECEIWVANALEVEQKTLPTFSGTRLHPKALASYAKNGEAYQLLKTLDYRRA